MSSYREDLRAVCNSNGNSKDQMIGALLGALDAYRIAKDSLRAVLADVVHSRNHQTLENASAAWQMDVAEIRNMMDVLGEEEAWLLRQAMRIHKQ